MELWKCLGQIGYKHLAALRPGPILSANFRNTTLAAFREVERTMGWIIALILLIFYALGLFVFHGTRAIHLLPLLALVVLIVDYLLAKRFRRR